MPDSVTIRDDDGRAFDVPADQVDAYKTQGFHQESDTEHEERVNEGIQKDLYGGVGGSLKSAGAGILSGVTLGGSDVALSALGARQSLHGLKENHPYLHGAGEFVGALLPGVLTGGASEAVEGAGLGARILAHTPAALVSDIGHGIGSGLAGEGAGFLARTGAAAASGAAEGALYSGGDYLSQVALDDKPLSAEGFVGAMGNGALYGAPIGGAFHLGSEALVKARSLFPKHEISAAAASGIDKQATSTIQQAVSDGDAMLDAAKQKLAQADSQVGAAAAGENLTRRAFGGPDPQAMVDQATGTVSKVNIQEAIGQYEAAKEQLGNWVAEEDPELEASLSGLKAPSVQTPGAVKYNPSQATLEGWFPETPDTIHDEMRAADRNYKVPPELMHGGGEPLPPSSAPDATPVPSQATQHFDFKDSGLEWNPEKRSYFDGSVKTEPTPPADLADLHERMRAADMNASAAKPMSADEYENYKKDYTNAASKHYDSELHYSKGGDEIVNPELRSGKPLTPAAEKLRNGLDAAFREPESRIPRAVTLYRGVSDDPILGVKGNKERYANVKPGDILQDPAYTSTSFEEKSKSRNEQFVLTISAPAGTPALPLRTHYTSEGEMLLPRNERMHVDRVEMVPVAERWNMKGVKYEVLPDKSTKIWYSDEPKIVPPIKDIHVSLINTYEPTTTRAPKITLDAPIDKLSLRQIGEYQNLLTDALEKAPDGSAERKALYDKWEEARTRRIGISDGKINPDKSYVMPNVAVASRTEPAAVVTAEPIPLRKATASVYNAKTNGTVPDYASLKSFLHGTDTDYFDTELPAKAIADRGYYEPPGGGADEVRAAKAKKAIAEGQREPIKLNVTPSGKITVTDGRHRLAAAIEADAPIKVKWSTGVEPISDEVFHAPKSSAAPTGPSDTLTGLLRGTQEKIGQGISMKEMGAPLRADYAAAKAEKTAAAAEHFRGRANEKNYAGSQMAADEKAMQEEAASQRTPAAESPAAETAPTTPAAEIVSGAHEGEMSNAGTHEDLKKMLQELPPPKKAKGIGKTIVDKELRGRMQGVNDEFKIDQLLKKRDGKGKDIGPDLNKAAKAIGDFEHASATLVDIVGDKAPPTAQANAQALREASAKQAATSGASIAKGAADINAKIPQTTVPGAGPGALSRAADVGSAMETLGALGAHIPLISHIPVIGPILGLFLKARAVMKILGRKGGSIGRSADGVIASKAAATRDRIAQATSAMLDAGIKVTGKASYAVGPAAMLTGKLFPGGSEPKSKDPRDLYEARMADITRAQQPGAVEHAIGASVNTSDPTMQDAVAAQVRKGIDFLATKMPKQTILPGILPGDGKWQPSMASINEFAKYVHAVNDPASVLEDLSKGHLSLEGAETLRTVYPNLFAEAQKILVQKAVDFQKSMPYTRRVALSIMYQVPVDNTMTPSHMTYLHQPAGGSGGGTGGSPPSAPPPVNPSGPAIMGQLQIGTQTMPPFDKRAGA